MAHVIGAEQKKRKNKMRLRTKLKQTIITGLSLVVLSFLSAVPGPARAAAGADAVPGQIIVQLQSDVAIDAINQTYGTTTLAVLNLDSNVYLLQVPEETDVEDLLERLATDPRIVYAELNLITESPEAIRSNDWAWGGQDAGPYQDQYALASINLAGAHNYSTGANIIVAVVDTGVQLDHPELAGHLTAIQADFVDGDGIAADEPNGLDEDGDHQVDEATGHGTHVAGIILLVAPDARIMPVRALDSDGTGNAFSVAEAILFAVDNGADVINLSLGTTEESELLEDAIEEAAESGVLVIAAAGNLGSTREVYPAAEECALAVTSVGPTDRKSNFASYGAWVDLAAPGESIYSTFPVDGYAWWSGTSMAAPFVSGQAALLLSFESSLDLEDTASLIAGTARSLPIVKPVRKQLLGVGKIDVTASLAALAAGEIPDGPELLDDDCGDD
jgi:subtilisin family serine protease